jgi:hypothetical protein
VTINILGFVLGIQPSQIRKEFEIIGPLKPLKLIFFSRHNYSIVEIKQTTTMKPDNSKKKQNPETSSKFKAFFRHLIESFIRKTDSEKRSDLFGTDPFRN